MAKRNITENLRNRELRRYLKVARDVLRGKAAEIAANGIAGNFAAASTAYVKVPRCAFVK